MKHILSCAGLAIALSLPVSTFAQVQNPPSDQRTFNHVEIGAYGDYFRTGGSGTSTVGFLGLGGRVGVNPTPHMALEGEMSYDFEKNYTTVSTSGNSGSGSTTTVTSKVRPLTGLFGPKFQFGTSGPFRAFLTGKVGFVEFSNAGNATASGSSFTGSFAQFGGGSTHFAAYPGGGIEAFLGPIGIRLEAGDEVYWNNGASNNLRITAGPSIRF